MIECKALARLRKQSGKQLIELREEPDGGFLHLSDAAGGSANRDCDRDRLIVIEQYRRERGAGLQLVTAPQAWRRFDGITQLAQAVDIASNGARVNPNPLAQLAARPTPTRLKYRQ